MTFCAILSNFLPKYRIFYKDISAQVYFKRKIIGQCLRRRLLIKILPFTFKAMCRLCWLRAYQISIFTERTHAGEQKRERGSETASRPHYKGFIYQKTNYSHAYAIKRRKKSSQRRTRKINFSCFAARFCLRLLAAPQTSPPLNLLRECELLSFVVYLCDYFAYRHSHETSGAETEGWRRDRRHFTRAQKVRKP